MRYVDMKTWPRRDHFRFFNRMDFPHFSVTAEQRITALRRYVTKNKLSIFRSILFAVSKAANLTEEFRYRVRGDQVVVHDRVHPSVTILTDDDIFGFCHISYSDNPNDFFKEAKKQITRARAGHSLADDPDRDDYLFISSLPWIRFTSTSHPIHMHPVDSVPRFTWGKYEEFRGEITMPVSVQVHHGLADGLHVGRFLEKLQGLFDEPESWLE